MPTTVPEMALASEVSSRIAQLKGNIEAIRRRRPHRNHQPLQKNNLSALIATNVGVDEFEVFSMLISTMDNPNVIAAMENVLTVARMVVDPDTRDAIAAHYESEMQFVKDIEEYNITSLTQIAGLRATIELVKVEEGEVLVTAAIRYMEEVMEECRTGVIDLVYLRKLTRHVPNLIREYTGGSRRLGSELISVHDKEFEFLSPSMSIRAGQARAILQWASHLTNTTT